MISLAIIPARGGSKRLPGKNIREFHGKPMIHYPIDAALESGHFDRIIVSTDDDEIASVALQRPVDLHARSRDAASDTAILSDVIDEVLDSEPRLPDMFCLILCNPFVTAANLAPDFTADEYMPVVKFGYPPQRGLVKRKTQGWGMREENHVNSMSQDLPPVYHDAGQFYWFRTPGYLKERKIILSSLDVLILPETEVQDIDTETDWAMAEMKYSLRKHHAAQIRQE